MNKTLLYFEKLHFNSFFHCNAICINICGYYKQDSGESDSIEHMCIGDISIDTVKQFTSWFVLHPIKSTKKKNNALWELHVQYPISSSSSTKRIGHSKRIGVTDVTDLQWFTDPKTTPDDLDMCILTIDKCHSDLTIHDILA